VLAFPFSDQAPVVLKRRFFPLNISPLDIFPSQRHLPTSRQAHLDFPVHTIGLNRTGRLQKARSPAHHHHHAACPGWVDKEFRDRREQEVAQFTGETGIAVKLLPGPESATEQLALWRKLLENDTGTPDVYEIDVIWPGTLAEYFWT